MVTPEQNAANLRSAENVAANALGVDKNNLTYQERTAYVAKLASVILANPERFSSETLATAQIVAGQRFSPLDDPTFDWDQFTSEVANNGVQTLGAVGEVGTGVTRAFSLMAWLIPGVVIVGAAILLWGWSERVRPARRSRA